MSRRILAALSDTHAGHQFGLMNPNVVLLDDSLDPPQTWTPTPTAVQRWLWGCYRDDMAAVARLAGDDEIIVIHNGDVTQGVRWPQGLISTRAADQYMIAVANLQPWLALPQVQTMRLLQGTCSHEFGQGTASILVAEHLANADGRDVASLRHGLLSVDGVRFDCAHHGPGPGIRQWTSGNQLRYYVRSLVNDEIARGREPPAAVIRSHYHGLVWETVRWPHEATRTTEAIVLPAYCGLTHYAAQQTRSAYLLSCGLVAFEIVDGRLISVHPFARTLDLRTEEEL